MPYNRPDAAIFDHDFINERRLMTLFRDFSKLRYNVKCNRDTMHDMMLVAIAPIPRGQRFPANGRYLDVEGAVNGAHWQAILRALDQEDRAIEAGRASCSSDARVSFNKAINALKLAFQYQGALPTCDIYDRESFEDHYNLIWVIP